MASMEDMPKQWKGSQEEKRHRNPLSDQKDLSELSTFALAKG